MDKREKLTLRVDSLKIIKSKLKKEFFGIDKQIDQLIDYVEPWYVFNDIQNRPTIINLFGMTGVGKTSLIQRLFKYLDMESDLYRFDVRNLLEDDKISSKMGTIKDTEKNQIGIIFDEFQNARTLDEMGNEGVNSGLRGLWDLLDSGKIEMNTMGFSVKRIYYSYTNLRSLIDEGVQIENGIFTKKKKLVKSRMGVDGFKLSKDKSDKYHIGNFLSDTFYDIKNELPEYRSYDNICNIMDELDTPGVMQFFDEILDKLSKPKIHDFTKSVIFIIGNLDEVYTDHDNFNPDMDADMLNNLSGKITISDIKNALSRRFRSEQISRLGNNHLIYSTLDVKTFKKIINKELKEINKDINDKYDISFKFNPSILDILYKESVYPTQGARPVYSRVNSIIRPIISKLLKKIFTKDIDTNLVEWEYIDKKHLLKFGDSELKFEFPLQIEDLRESKNDDNQCKISVHEAGHAVCSIVNLKILPKSIYSKTADSNSEGFCSFETPKQKTRKFYNDYIKVLLGGYVAEKMVFGKENLGNGCYGDFQKSTNMALRMVKLYGMYSDPMIMTTHNNSNQNFDFIKVDMNIDRIASNIIRENLEEVEITLIEYKELFYNISKYLSMNSFLDQKKLSEIISEINPELLDDIRDKDNYYDFKNQFSKFFLK